MALLHSLTITLSITLATISYISITIIKVEPARRAYGFLQSERQKQLRQRKVSCSVWQPPSCGKGIVNDYHCPWWDFHRLVILRNISLILMTTQQTMEMKRKIWKPGRHIESHDGLSRKSHTAGLGRWSGRYYFSLAVCLLEFFCVFSIKNWKKVRKVHIVPYLSLSLTSVEERGS